jgi:hypothetical protein
MVKRVSTSTEERLRSHKRTERCSALIKQHRPKKPLTSIAGPIRRKYAQVFRSFENIDCTGSRICALEERADVQGVRFVSKKVFNVTGFCWELVAWVLTAQRMFDPITNEKVLAPAAANRPSFIQANLLALRKKYDNVNRKAGKTDASVATLKKRQSDPSRSAGNCSGHTFLNTLCDDADQFQAFVSWCQYLHGRIAARTGAGKPGIQIVDFMSDTAEKTKIMKYMRSCPMTGRYYLMRTLVAIQHQLDKSNPAYRVRWCACKLCPELWSFLLEYDSGAAEKAKKYGLLVFTEAQSLVLAIRAIYPRYCLCDLACYLASAL